MGIVNQNFYDLQAGRPYPIDELASAEDDRGQYLASDILVDCCLRFPQATASDCYVAGITVTAKLVTVLLCADVAGYLPLAAVTLAQPVIPGKAYTVSPFQPGVGGWLVFGPGVQTPQTYRFSTAAQSRILARCARSLPLPPVLSLAKVGRATTLQGLVTLLAGSDLVADVEPLFIGGVSRTALVFRLATSNTNQNNLQNYAGPCSARPESGTCLWPGVQLINGVPPDCSGNITISFEGVSTSPFPGGIELDSSQSMAKLCQASSYTPKTNNLCPPESLGSSAAMSITSFSLGAEPELFRGSPLSLPYSLNFRTQPATDFAVAAGQWGSGSYASQSTSTRNVSLVQQVGAILGTRVTTQLAVAASTASKNGGIVLNWRMVTVASGEAIETYLMTMVDLTTNQLKLLRFNGSGFVTEYASGILPLRAGDIYQLQTTIQALSSLQGVVSASLSGITAPSFPVTTFSVATTQLATLNATGHNGLGSNYAACSFYTFTMDRP